MPTLMSIFASGKAGHVVMLSAPELVAETIIQAAQAAK